ncbi:MAG: PIN domain-containing protein [Chloroflexi bacterium]|nr:PIN domain-containing protein [Chloroflexota bacterium]
MIVDTSAFYAMTASGDTFHDKAMAVFRRLVGSESRLLTNSYVLIESASLIHRRLGFQVTQAFMDSVMAIVEIVWVDDLLHRKAWDIVSRRQGTRLTLVDASVMALAQDLSAMVFSYDQDFTQEGLVVVA